MTYRLAVATALALLLLTPGVGQAAQGKVMMADLRPLAGNSERVLLQGTFQRGVGRITVAWEVEDFGYLLRLSGRTCDDLPKALDKSSPKLSRLKTGSGGFTFQNRRTSATRRAVRAAASVVLVRRRANGDLEPRACGSRKYETQADILGAQSKAFLGGVFVGFDGRSERGLVQMSMQRENQVLTIAGDGADGAVGYAVRLSRRSCDGVEREPGRPGYVGPSLTTDRAFSGRVRDYTDIVQVSRRAARSAKSIVLGAKSDSSTYEPRACATAYFAEVVPWF
jgi:hypothetical protein